MGTLLLLGLLLVAGPALVVFAFLTTRALVSGGRRRGRAAAGLAVSLVALAAWLALGLGGARAYPDQRCANHLPPGFGAGSWTQGAGLWPPGLECHFRSSSGVESTYRDGFDLVWVAVAITAVFASTLGLVVVEHRRRVGIVPLWS